MRKKTMLEWNVFVGDFNSGLIERHNVFDHWRFMEDLKKLARRCKDTEREQFEKELKRDLMYYYWSKCEWEIVVDHFPPSDNKDRFRPSKIDVWDQIELNWQNFTDYVWAHRAELRRREKKNGV